MAAAAAAAAHGVCDRQRLLERRPLCEQPQQTSATHIKERSLILITEPYATAGVATFSSFLAASRVETICSLANNSFCSARDSPSRSTYHG